LGQDTFALAGARAGKVAAVFLIKQNQYIAPPSLDNKNNMRERTTRLLDVLEREGVLRETDGNIRFSDDFR